MKLIVVRWRHHCRVAVEPRIRLGFVNMPKLIVDSELVLSSVKFE